MTVPLQALIGLHIAAGLTSVATGAATMLAVKGPGAHPRRGRAYLCALSATAATGLTIALSDWTHLWHLAALGTTAAGAAALGYLARRRRANGWLATHIIGMGGSYVLMLTAFYIDNGPRLPLWNVLPPLSFWVLPTAIGAPIIIRALRRHTRSPERQIGPQERPRPADR